MSIKKCTPINTGVVKFKNCVINTNKLAPLICIKPISAEAVPACLGNKLNARPADEPSVSAKPNAAINIGNINASAVRCWLKANIKAPAITSNKRPAFNARFGWRLMYSGIIKLATMLNTALQVNQKVKSVTLPPNSVISQPGASVTKTKIADIVTKQIKLWNKNNGVLMIGIKRRRSRI